MKNVTIVLNVILLIAVAVLFYFQFSSPKQDEKKGLKGEEDISLEEVNIAYINLDSVLNNYDYFQEEQSRLEEKTMELENRYKGRAEGLQEEMAYFQQNRGNMTINQARAQQENLMQKQQNLRMYEQKLSQELMEMNTEIQDNVYEEISKYLDGYSKENNIQLILTYQKGSGVWYAHDALNITDKVIDGLNNEYNTDDSENTTTSEQDTTKAE